MAGLVALLALPVAALVAGAEPALFQTRYVVQPGDTLGGLAWEFGVEPEAILASSFIANAPALTPGEIVVIPTPRQTPEEAAVDAAARYGQSPYVLGAHTVAAGETVGQIADWYTVDANFLAEFNGLPDIDAIAPGDRLLIPVSFGLPGPLPPDGASDPVAEGAQDAGTWWTDAANLAPAAEAWVGDESVDTAETVSRPGFVPNVPTHLQRYRLGSAYAAASIATATFGNGIDEDVFRVNIGPSPNPHWGYRGWIDGAWGTTDDSGVYPEALAPTLEANGFVADVFYAQGDASALTARLDDGMPVAVWLSYLGEPGFMMEDAGTYKLVPGTRVVVAHGYDAGGVHISNPGSGQYEYLDWGSFMTMWGALDGMALGVAPA